MLKDLAAGFVIDGREPVLSTHLPVTNHRVASLKPRT